MKKKTIGAVVILILAFLFAPSAYADDDCCCPLGDGPARRASIETRATSDDGDGCCWLGDDPM